MVAVNLSRLPRLIAQKLPSPRPSPTLFPTGSSGSLAPWQSLRDSSSLEASAGGRGVGVPRPMDQRGTPCAPFRHAHRSNKAHLLWTCAYVIVAAIFVVASAPLRPSRRRRFEWSAYRVLYFLLCLGVSGFLGHTPIFYRHFDFDVGGQEAF